MVEPQRISAEDEVLDPEPEPADLSLRDAAPGLLRLAAGAWLRTASWTAATTWRAGRRLTEAAVSGESAVDLADDARREVLDGARRLLGVSELEQRLGATRGPDGGEGDSLRRRAEELLERSADVSFDGEGHPAYERILAEMAPDEARIMRLIHNEGAQAAVDVRTWRPLGVGSRVVAPGLTMIGKHAGCMRPDRVPHYLSNLFRLGLIWFSREALRDPKDYEVLEAQPDVVEALEAAGRASTVRRSIELTPFGRHFCELSLPATTAEFEAIRPV